MPARISEGYLRVTFPGFDRKLPTWRGRKIKDLSLDEQEKLVWTFNEMILSGKYDAVKMWFPRERAKTLVKNVCWDWYRFKPVRPSTMKQRADALNKYIIPHNGNQSIKELTRQDFYWIREEHGDTRTAKNIRAKAGAFLNWCWHEGLIDRQIFLPTVSLVKKPIPYIELADRWEIWKGMNKLYQEPTLLSIEMGMRVGEIIALKKDAVDIERSRIRLIRSLSYTEIVDMPKGGDEVWLPLDMPYIKYTKDMLAEKIKNLDSQYIFTAQRGGIIWPQLLAQEFKRVAREIGLPQVRFHHNRNSFAQDRLDEGYHLEEVQALLGHKHKATTEIYTGIMRVNRLKKIGRVK